MEVESRDLARARAPRLAALVAPHPVALIVAPEEYRPLHAAEEAMKHLHGVGGFRTVTVPDDREALLEAVRAGVPVVANVPDPDPGPISRLHDELVAEFGDREVPQVLGVLSHDGCPETLTQYPFSLVLDHRELVATPEEVAVIRPEVVGNPALLHQVLAHTGGVPALLEAMGPGTPGYPAAVARAARDWAGRLYPLLAEDEVLALLVWLGRAAHDTLVVIGSEVVGHPLPPIAVQHRAERPWVTAPDTLLPGVPGGLARALRDLLEVRDPARSARWRERVAQAARTNDRVRGLDRVMVLTALADWEGVDAVLATKLHLLTTLSRGHRAWFAGVWPPRPSTRLRHLIHARRFVTGASESPDLPVGTPEHWQELVFLLRGEAPPQPGSLTAAVRHRLAQVALRRSFDLPTGRRELDSLATWVGEQVHLFEAQPEHGLRSDEAALLRVLLLAISDTAVAVGALAQAQSCVRRALRLGRDLTSSGSAYPTLWAPTMARASFLAAHGGQSGVVRQRLNGFQQALDAVGPTDHQSELLVTIAERYPRGGASLRDTTLRFIDLDSPFAPFAAEAEAMRAILLHGPDAGTQWVRGLLSRAAWSQRPDWEWWPLHALMALLDAREGRVSLAEGWLERSTLPPALDLAVRASIELASGRPDFAVQIADRVLQLSDTPTRWRQVAIGVKLASACGAGAGGEATLLIDADDWGDVLGSVVLFPRAARQMLLSRVGAAAAALPGISVVAPPETPAASAVDVKLTPRQLQVLQALGSDRTMVQIAQSLFVSHETVRSTAKALYRRLGVGDRDAAVQAGRALGLI